MYRYIHETLATNQRLYMLKIKDNSDCEKCGESEHQLHIFYFCKSIKYCVNWFQKILLKVCELCSYKFLEIVLYNIVLKNKKKTKSQPLF